MKGDHLHSSRPEGERCVWHCRAVGPSVIHGADMPAADRHAQAAQTSFNPPLFMPVAMGGATSGDGAAPADDGIPQQLYTEYTFTELYMAITDVV